MNGEMEARRRVAAADAKKTPDSNSNVPEVNPFVHTINLSIYDRIKVYVLTIVLLPARVLALCFCLLMAYLLAVFGTVGLSEEDMRLKPMKGWRRSLSVLITAVSRFLFHAWGFRVRVIGKQATASEAPILLCAPHGSFLDGYVVHWTALPCLIIRSQDKERPIMGKGRKRSHRNVTLKNELINYTQPVYVRRDDPNSRQNTIKEIVRRATSNDDWQQVLIFPEGTCTNRSGLITFKPGAFYPGVPVQPVCIRYPNRLDTVSWTWEGPGALELLWLTLTQFCTYCEIEFLPVYVPSEEERQDPHLFANNFRDVMARALHLPVTDYTYEDCRLMSKAKKLALPPSVALVGVSKLRKQFGYDLPVLENDLLPAYKLMANHSSGLVTVSTLARYLHLPPTEPIVAQLFELYDTDHSKVVDFKKVLVGRYHLSQRKSRVNLSWQDMQDLLKISAQDLIHLRQFVFEFNSDANENDALDNLCAAVPEWSWIVNTLSNNRSD